jgi:hypothetical protein
MPSLRHFPQLQAFSDECRQLGRSYVLILTARTLREELDQFVRLFYYNAKQLSGVVQEPSQVMKHSADGDIDNGFFPSCLESVAEAFEVLRERLHEFREYTVSICRVLQLSIQSPPPRMRVLILKP